MFPITMLTLEGDAFTTDANIHYHHSVIREWLSPFLKFTFVNHRHSKQTSHFYLYIAK